MDKSIDTNKAKNLVIPTEKPLSEAQLIFEIEKAEKGSFISVEEGMKDFEQWLQTRERK
jgi:hypothetical protein